MTATNRKPYRITRLSDPVDIETALVGIRLLLEANLASEVFRPGKDISYDAIHLLIGVRPRDDLSARQARQAFSTIPDVLRRRARILKARLATLPTPPHQANLRRFGQAVGLGLVERRLMHLMLLAQLNQQLEELLQFHGKERPRLVYLDLARLLDSSEVEVRGALRSDGALMSTGLLDPPAGWREGPLGSLPRWIADALSDPEFCESRVLRLFAERQPTSRLAEKDYAHLGGRLGWVRSFLADSLQRASQGVNILLHGPPGTGKTEFARLIAQQLGVPLHGVPYEDPDGDPLKGEARMRAYATAQRLLAGRGPSLMLFDEIEDAFPDEGPKLFGFDFGRKRSNPKRWTNELLESNPVPALWLSNSVQQLDEAYLRRFDLVLELPSLTTRQRGRMVDKMLEPLGLDAALRDRLAHQEGLEPAQLERIARVVTTEGIDSTHVGQRVEWMVEGYLGARGRHLQRPKHAVLPAAYRPDLLNVDADLESIVAGLTRSGRGRLCLYGAPGTGKSAFAQHLADRLDRPLLVKRGSDLLSRWVGGTEANIAKAFREANQDGAVLLIDEADSFLRPRENAQHSWEVTQVNELLTAMEAFEGVFVASTNLFEHIDSAALRRFDLKLRFDALRPEQSMALLREWLVRLDSQPEEQALAIASHQLRAMPRLTPGDFATVARRLDLASRSRELPAWLDALADEASHKPEARRRSVGFLAGRPH